jgi:anti-sigma factor RsiW
MKCNQAEPLIPSYLDGELSEAQAGPLRKHLLDCQPCRASAQGEKNLKRWFVPEEDVAIPRDFASRVARRAIAGDRGERFSPAGVIAAAEGNPFDARGEDPSLNFVLQLTSLAAAVLIFLSLAIGSLKLPSGNKMQADSTREIKLERAIDELDRLNAAYSNPGETASGIRAPVAGATTTITNEKSNTAKIPAGGSRSP